MPVSMVHQTQVKRPLWLQEAKSFTAYNPSAFLCTSGSGTSVGFSTGMKHIPTTQRVSDNPTVEKKPTTDISASSH